MTTDREQWRYRLLCPGSTPEGRLFVELKYDNRLNPTRPLSLSFSGVIGPKANGDATGSCGQIVDHLREIDRYGAEWYPELVDRLADLWRTWHLNTMQAGSPAQTAYLEAHAAEWPGYPTDHYRWACETLASAGLNPDPTYLHEGIPYQYGHAWLTVEVPEEILEELFSLPESTRPLPGEWGRS